MEAMALPSRCCYYCYCCGCYPICWYGCCFSFIIVGIIEINLSRLLLLRTVDANDNKYSDGDDSMFLLSTSLPEKKFNSFINDSTTFLSFEDNFGANNLKNDGTLLPFKPLIIIIITIINNNYYDEF